MSGFNAAVMEQVRKEAIVQGMAEGVEKGMAQGVGMGQRNTLKRLIQRRFGELPSDYQNKIDQVDEEQLMEWLDNFVDAETIEQVFQ